MEEFILESPLDESNISIWFDRDSGPVVSIHSWVSSEKPLPLLLYNDGFEMGRFEILLNLI